MGEDILSVIFLALICIVIAGIVHRLVPADMMVPSFALIAVCLWIAYDYILLSRYKAKQACLKQDSDAENIEGKIRQLSEELGENDNDDHSQAEEPGNTSNEQGNTDDSPLTPKAQHKNEFDIDLFDKEMSIQELYKESGCAGDTRTANRMKYMGLQARMSQDIRARWNTEKFRPYFEEELRDNETRDWWDNEAEHLDELM